MATKTSTIETLRHRPVGYRAEVIPGVSIRLYGEEPWVDDNGIRTTKTHDITLQGKPSESNSRECRVLTRKEPKT